MVCIENFITIGGGSLLIKVFIVDDHPLVRQGLKAFLAIQEGIEIVGEAGDGETAWEGIRKYQPDVAIIDLHLRYGMGC